MGRNGKVRRPERLGTLGSLVTLPWVSSPAVVIRCGNATRVARELCLLLNFDADVKGSLPGFTTTSGSNRTERPLLIDAPLNFAQIVDEACGVGRSPDTGVAVDLLARARRLLQIPRPADSRIERQWQAESTAEPGALDLARMLIEAHGDDAVKGVRQALARLRATGLGEIECFARVAELRGPAPWPVVVVASSRRPAMTATVHLLVQAAETLPAVRLVLTVEPAAWNALERALDPHTLAVLQQRGIDWVEPEQANPRSADMPTARAVTEPAGPCTRGGPGQGTSATDASSEAPAPLRSTLPALRERARLAVNDAMAATPATASPAARQARSLAEALLHAALEVDERTTGLFVLNAPGGFEFGDREAEIDLYAASPAIAVEVDGYFHFQDMSAYRRDRAKDWLMQKQGMLVLRFVAEDVTGRLEQVVDRIAQAVALRRATTGVRNVQDR